MAEGDVAEEMQDYAEAAVAMARDKFKTALDFSEESLQEVERILGILHKDVPKNWLTRLLRLGPSPEELWHMAYVWGGYVGEVIRRRWGGEWTTQSALSPEPVITLRVTGTEIWPPMRVFKRLTQGSEDNVWHYYGSLKRDFEETP